MIQSTAFCDTKEAVIIKALLIPVSVQCEVSCPLESHRGVPQKSAVHSDSVPPAAPSYDREVLVGIPRRAFFCKLKVNHTSSRVLYLTPVSAFFPLLSALLRLRFSRCFNGGTGSELLERFHQP